jgi:serum/glucocorticoid-regulated kinase 2
MPSATQEALKANTERLATSNSKDSVTRRCWFLPYVVLEFDKNAIMIDAVGGQMSSPSWVSQADLLSVSPESRLRRTLMYFTFNYSDVSRVSQISVSAYLRTQQPSKGKSKADMGNDILLARLDLDPSLEAFAVTIVILNSLCPYSLICMIDK